jgi:hypothetical protein
MFFMKTGYAYNLIFKLELVWSQGKIQSQALNIRDGV